MYILDENNQLDKVEAAEKVCVFITDRGADFLPEDDDLTEYQNEVFNTLKDALIWLDTQKIDIRHVNVIIHNVDLYN